MKSSLNSSPLPSQEALFNISAYCHSLFVYASLWVDPGPLRANPRSDKDKPTSFFDQNLKCVK